MVGTVVSQSEHARCGYSVCGPFAQVESGRGLLRGRVRERRREGERERERERKGEGGREGGREKRRGEEK